MIVNQRIKAIREFRGMKGKELARAASLTAGAISLLERQNRAPRLETVQKIAAALEVSVSYLLGEEDDDLPLPKALARQSLKVFLRLNRNVSESDEERLQRIEKLDTSPTTVQGWKNFVTNADVFR